MDAFTKELFEMQNACMRQTTSKDRFGFSFFVVIEDDNGSYLDG